jgi:hypothetical protein
MRKAIGAVDIPRKQIVFWNFYAAYEDMEDARVGSVDWADELQKLIELLPDLAAVIAFGRKASLGMRDVALPRGVVLIGAPPAPPQRIALLDSITTRSG